MECKGVPGFKDSFDLQMKELNKRDNCAIISDEYSYNKIIEEVLEIKEKEHKTSTDYRRLKRYDVLTAGDIKKLIVPTKDSKQIQYYAHGDEVYDIICAAHISTGHGGLHKVHESLRRKYVNISRRVILLFLSLCETCQKKRAFPKKGVVIKPLLFNEVGARSQVDLVDMQSCKDRDYKFILNYQDQLTKYVVLRPLKTKTAAEVAYNLMDIFCTFGCPATLQSDNGREFVNAIINELYLMWPGLKIVHGKPRHSQSQGSIERANRDVGDMIRAWMSDNKSTTWSDGLRFVQYAKNNSLHSGIRQTPFRAMFGRDAKMGLTDSTLPAAVINKVNSEEELNEILASSSQVPESAMETESISDDDLSETNIDADNVDERVLCTGRKRNRDEAQIDVLETTHQSIKNNQQEAYEGLQSQAKRMRSASEAKFKPLDIGMNVLIPIPDVDRSKGDPKNMIGIVMEVTDGFYKLGTKSGILSSLYTRNQIAPSSTAFITIDEIPNKATSLRSANKESSLVGGQGFLRCACTTKCVNNRCICKKKKLSCNSRCHNSLPCCNKN